jgi:choline kinase
MTNDRPKCLVEVAGKPLIDWQMEAASRLGLQDVAVVTGYRAETFEQRGCRWYHNPYYADTNMVETLWFARAEFQEEMIVSYGDILYEDSVLQALARSGALISVVIDLDWRPYWEMRFPDPLSDAESLRLDGDGRIVEIGQEVAAIEDIQGQYIGLMKFHGGGIEAVQEIYMKLRTNGVVGKGGRPFWKMHMTDLLQAIIEAGYEVHAVSIRRKWLEIDSIVDYELAKQYVRSGPSGLHILI